MKCVSLSIVKYKAKILMRKSSIYSWATRPLISKHENSMSRIIRSDSSVGRLLCVCLVERFAVRVSPLAFFADAPYICGSQKTLWQDCTGSLAFLTVVSVEVFRHQAIVGELVTVQGIECCALTFLTYLTWLVCWTSVEVAHHRATRSPLQPL